MMRIATCLLGLALPLCGSGIAGQTQEPLSEVERDIQRLFGRHYSRHRLQRFLEKEREQWEAMLRWDVDALVRALRDPDPWVAMEAAETVLPAIARLRGAPALESEPFADYATRMKQVDRVQEWVDAHRQVVLPAIGFGEAPWTDEREVAIWRSRHYPDNLGILLGLADRQAYNANIEAIYLLKALLDNASLDVRAEALRTLVYCTTPDKLPVNPPDGRLTEELVESKKKEWLAWWAQNEKTYKPVKRSGPWHPPPPK